MSSKKLPDLRMRLRTNNQLSIMRNPSQSISRASRILTNQTSLSNTLFVCVFMGDKDEKSFYCETKKIKTMNQLIPEMPHFGNKDIVTKHNNEYYKANVVVFYNNEFVDISDLCCPAFYLDNEHTPTVTIFFNKELKAVNHYTNDLSFKTVAGFQKSSFSPLGIFLSI